MVMLTVRAQGTKGSTAESGSRPTIKEPAG
jgi:hypothetical protein